MQALQPQPTVFTLETYEALPEDIRAEVFDGQVYYMASPSQEHQAILTELLVSIRNYLRKKGGGCQVFPAPFDVKLSDKPLTIVQPDIMIVCDRSKLDLSTIKVNIYDDLYINFSDISELLNQ